MANNYFPLVISFIFTLFIGHGVFLLQASHIIHAVSHVVNNNSLPILTQHRTAFHFQPPRNWMNDPNGPMVHKGIYHLFYQYNPQGADWGNIVWAHSTSRDLVNWEPHPAAIRPSDQGDVKGCWSGSVTFINGGKVPAILYTGINAKKEQVQDLAVPKNLSDPFLIEWVKNARNPLMAPTPMNQINVSSFRDPTTAWQGPDKVWRVLVGSKVDRTGLAVLYKSKDFVTWTKHDKPLHSASNTGMWECPDFYPVAMGKQRRLGQDWSVNGNGIRHVLKNSLDDTKHDYYTIGTYDSNKDIYVPIKGSVDSDAGLKYDYGKYYASKTFFDGPKRRRILWGWVNESMAADEYIKQGWAGVQAIPRTVTLHKSGRQLVQWPVREIEKLREKKFELIKKGKKNEVLKAKSVLEIKEVTGAQADVMVTFTGFDLRKAETYEKGISAQELCSQKGYGVAGAIGPFGLNVLATSDQKEFTSVFFRIFKGTKKPVVLMCSDQRKSSLNKKTDKTTYGAFVQSVGATRHSVSLRILVDNSIVESFGAGGKSVITARVYPTLALGKNAKIFAVNQGTTDVQVSMLTAWSMKKAVIA